MLFCSYIKQGYLVFRIKCRSDLRIATFCECRESEFPPTGNHICCRCVGNRSSFCRRNWIIVEYKNKFTRLCRSDLRIATFCECRESEFPPTGNHICCRCVGNRSSFCRRNWIKPKLMALYIKVDNWI